MLFYSKGKGLSENLGFYLDTLEKEKISVSGDIFIMDVVNSLITSNPDNYCTMIYALKGRHILPFRPFPGSMLYLFAKTVFAFSKQ